MGEYVQGLVKCLAEAAGIDIPGETVKPGQIPHGGVGGEDTVVKDGDL